MAVGVAPVQRKGPLQTILPIGGAIVGGIVSAPGGPATAGGIAAGAGLGSTAAGIVEPAPQPGPIQSAEAQGMQRRAGQLDQDPLRAIAEAQAALQSLPPEQFPETRRAFDNAMALAQRNQQLGRGQGGLA